MRSFVFYLTWYYLSCSGFFQNMWSKVKQKKCFCSSQEKKNEHARGPNDCFFIGFFNKNQCFYRLPSLILSCFDLLFLLAGPADVIGTNASQDTKPKLLIQFVPTQSQMIVFPMVFAENMKGVKTSIQLLILLLQDFSVVCFDHIFGTINWDQQIQMALFPSWG